MTNKRDIYIAIMRAAARREGIRLSADECFDLSLDDAIATAAQNRLSTNDAKLMEDGKISWDGVNPKYSESTGNYFVVGDINGR